MKRSAQVAGFFDMGKDRLVVPPGLNPSTPINGSGNGEEYRRDESPPPVDPATPGLHPAVAGMLHEFPKQGEKWDEDDLREFLDIFSSVVIGVHKKKVTQPLDMNVSMSYNIFAPGKQSNNRNVRGGTLAGEAAPFF
jgi:hypothetical protein